MSQVPAYQIDQPPRNAPVWLKLLLALHIVFVTIWAIPNPRTEVIEGKAKPAGTEAILVWNRDNLKTFSPVTLYLFVTGFWQYWDMFSPNPASMDYWLDAEVEYKDGSMKRYAYPRMYDLSIPQKFLKERYRKFYERVNDDKNPFLWPVVAQRIAFLNDDPANPPVTVRLTRHWKKIVAPGQVQKPDYDSYMYFEYHVDPKKLARARAGYR